MTRLEIFQDLIARFNNKQGSIRELILDYEKYNYTRSMFKTDLKKYNFVMDNDMYVLEDEQGQDRLIKDIENDKEPISKPQARQTSPKEPKEQIKENGPIKMKKKTFEIDETLEPLLKIQAIKEGKTLNQYVNDVLKRSIEQDTRDFIKN